MKFMIELVCLVTSLNLYRISLKYSYKQLNYYLLILGSSILLATWKCL